MNTNSASFLSPQQLSQRWGGAVSTATLANWRAKGRGPAWVKVGTRIRYRLADVEAYEREQTRQPRPPDDAAATQPAA